MSWQADTESFEPAPPVMHILVSTYALLSAANERKLRPNPEWVEPVRRFPQRDKTNELTVDVDTTVNGWGRVYGKCNRKCLHHFVFHVTFCIHSYAIVCCL